jgi:hypothetical protein
MFKISPSYAKGGSLKEKQYLAELKQFHRKELREDERFFKNILKNNEIMQKSLIKVFK